MTTSTDPVQNPLNLWNPQITPQQYGTGADLYYTHALEQYKIYVESAEQVSSRRATMNALFVTVQALLVTTVGVVLDAKWVLQPRWLILFPLAGALLLCWYWLQLLQSYRSLNKGKFLVIEAYEKRLPTAPFVEAEWRNVLNMHTGKGRYKRFTEVERSVPIAFMILYCLGALTVIFFT